jgi:hypothetical protein
MVTPRPVGDLHVGEEAGVAGGQHQQRAEELLAQPVPSDPARIPRPVPTDARKPALLGMFSASGRSIDARSADPRHLAGRLDGGHRHPGGGRPYADGRRRRRDPVVVIPDPAAAVPIQAAVVNIPLVPIRIPLTLGPAPAVATPVAVALVPTVAVVVAAGPGRAGRAGVGSAAGVRTTAGSCRAGRRLSPRPSRRGRAELTHHRPWTHRRLPTWRARPVAGRRRNGGAASGWPRACGNGRRRARRGRRLDLDDARAAEVGRRGVEPLRHRLAE